MEAGVPMSRGEGVATVRGRVTSADVARESGVSRATVSYVLNNTPNKSISEATRVLVRETAARLGHVPNVTARLLSTGRSNIIVALVPGFTVGYVTDTALEALDRAVSAQGYVLLVHRHSPELRPLSELWSFIEPAFIVSMGGLSEEDRSAIASYDAPHFGVRGIIPHVEIGRMQASYLVSRGHRVLGFARTTDPNVRVISTERLEGARAVCAENGLPDPLVRDVDLGRETMSAALDGWQQAGVTGVCAHNDLLAAAVISALHASGLRSPEHLAVIGVDNVPQMSYGLTTVAIDVDAYASTVSESVLALLHGQPAPKWADDIVSLVVRDSA